MVDAVSRTPGRISRAKARVGGNAALSESNALLALRSVGASSRIEARRLPDSDANVAVVVRAINSRKVFVTGRVTTPGAHPLVGPLTIMQAIALAGGVTEYADSKNISVLRNEGGQVRTFKFNYKDVAKGKNLEQNIRLLPGDTVVVP